jgi:CheY-like chemotaxis protein
MDLRLRTLSLKHGWVAWIMKQQKTPITILAAEDDPDDRLLIKEALKESGFIADLRFVEDGEELMDYLRRRGEYGNSETSPRPGLILLDLNLPRKDGREALAEIKTDPDLRRLPVVVVTTSDRQEDILRCYDMGANSYITKPIRIADLLDAFKALSKYWLEIVSLPPKQSGERRD